MSEEKKGKKKKWYFLPLIFVAIHTLAIVGFYFYNTHGEVGAGWEYVFGVIDFIIYLTIGVPQCVAEIGVNPEGSWADALWFGITGGIQWFMIGCIIVYIKRLIKKKKDKK